MVTTVVGPAPVNSMKSAVLIATVIGLVVGGKIVVATGVVVNQKIIGTEFM
jgi:hypothetical protein